MFFLIHLSLNILKHKEAKEIMCQGIKARMKKTKERSERGDVYEYQD